MAGLAIWPRAAWGGDLLPNRPGATTSFVSRGSQRWAAGVPVTTATIAGHKDMSYTGCPGDQLYPVVRNQLPQWVTDERARVTAMASNPGPYVKAPRVGPPVHLPPGSAAPSGGRLGVPPSGF